MNQLRLSEESRGQFHQRVYAQLLRSQIPKVQKRPSTQAAAGSAGVKAARKHVDEIDP